MLYQKLLERDFDKLPPVLRDFHSTPGGGRASGRVAVRHANPLLARLLRFPACGQDIPIQLQVVASGDREVWIRRFDRVVRRSVQWQKGDLLVEAAGPVRLLLRVIADSSGMRFECQAARLWMIPIPLRVEATVRGLPSSWEFNVKVNRVGSYTGWMEPTP